jgi:hypothetical protein
VLISQAEFARLSGVSRSAVKQAIDNGLITAIKKEGNKILIQKNEALRQYQPKNTQAKEVKIVKQKADAIDEKKELNFMSWGSAPATSAAPKPRPPSRPPVTDLADDDLDAEPDIDDDKVPNFNDERALHEREKRLIARMERKKEANKLLPREEVGQAWDAAVNITRTVMLGVPSKAKQRIPHLTPDEVAVLMDLIREALSGLAAGDVMELYPEVEP